MMKMETCLQIISQACREPPKAPFTELDKKRTDAIAKCNEALKGICEAYLIEKKYYEIVTLYDKVVLLMKINSIYIAVSVFLNIQLAFVSMKVDQLHGQAQLPYDWYERYTEMVRTVYKYLADRRQRSDVRVFMKEVINGLRAVHDIHALSLEERSKVNGTMLLLIPMEIAHLLHCEQFECSMALTLMERCCIENRVDIPPIDLEVSARCLLYENETSQNGYSYLWNCMLSDLYHSLKNGVFNMPRLVYFPEHAKNMLDIFYGKIADFKPILLQNKKFPRPFNITLYAHFFINLIEPLAQSRLPTLITVSPCTDPETLSTIAPSQTKSE